MTDLCSHLSCYSRSAHTACRVYTLKYSIRRLSGCSTVTYRCSTHRMLAGVRQKRVRNKGSALGMRATCICLLIFNINTSCLCDLSAAVFAPEIMTTSRCSSFLLPGLFTALGSDGQTRRSPLQIQWEKYVRSSNVDGIDAIHLASWFTSSNLDAMSVLSGSCQVMSEFVTQACEAMRRLHHSDR